VARERGAVMKSMANPYQRDGYCIINKYGDVWSAEIFRDKKDAVAELDRFWGDRAKWIETGYTLANATSIVIVTGKERIELP
jgi:hypothetical protein